MCKECERNHQWTLRRETSVKTVINIVSITKSITLLRLPLYVTLPPHSENIPLFPQSSSVWGSGQVVLRNDASFVPPFDTCSAVRHFVRNFIRHLQQLKCMGSTDGVRQFLLAVRHFVQRCEASHRGTTLFQSIRQLSFGESEHKGATYTEAKDVLH